MARTIDAPNGGARAEADPLLGEEPLANKGERRGIALVGHDVLGQRRPLVGEAGFVAQDDDRSRVPGSTQRVGGLDPGLPGTDDDGRCRSRGRCSRLAASMSAERSAGHGASSGAAASSPGKISAGGGQRREERVGRLLDDRGEQALIAVERVVDRCGADSRLLGER
nr:hypothetical protein [Pseudonocardia sp. N23]